MRTVLVTCPECLHCGKSAEVELDASAVERWQRGAYIQDVFPDMSPDERELLISGTHPKCWIALMGGE